MASVMTLKLYIKFVSTKGDSLCPRLRSLIPTVRKYLPIQKVRDTEGLIVSEFTLK